MKSKYTALLVHARSESFETAKIVLEELSVAPAEAQNRQDVESHLSRVPPPHLVITVPVFPGGNWWDVLDLAAKASEKINVIVVSPTVDIDLYLEVMSHGGFDFITDGFTVPELVHVLRVALNDAARSREMPKRLSSAVQTEPSSQLAT